MLTTPHAVAGAAIGSLLPNPFLYVPLAVASHYLLDSVPHWQETLAPYTPTAKTYIRIPFDIILAVSLVAIMVHWQPQHANALWIGAIGGNVADFDSFLAVAPRLKKGLLGTYWDWHCKIQRETSSLLGLLPQILVIGLGLLLVRIQ